MDFDDLLLFLLLGGGAYVYNQQKKQSQPVTVATIPQSAPLKPVLNTQAIIINPLQQRAEGLDQYSASSVIGRILGLNPPTVNPALPGYYDIGGESVSKQPQSNILSPEEALKIIQEGQISYLRTQKISNYFTWGEVFTSRTDAEVKAILNPANNHYKMSAITILNNAAKNAKTLDAVRVKLNKPLKVTSWYRGPAANRAAGGAADSRHMYGDSTDIAFGSPGVGGEAQKVFYLYDPSYIGGLGRYGGNRANIVHFDSRGYKARWFHQ